MDLARLNLALVDVDLAVGSGEAGAVAKARERVGPVHARAVVQARLRLEQMTSKEIKYLNNNYEKEADNEDHIYCPKLDDWNDFI